MTSIPEPPLQSSNAAAIAAALWDSADLEGAAHHYERALRENAHDREALHGLGRLRLAQNDLAAATMLLEQALSLSLALPQSQRDELTRRVRHDLAWALYRLDRFDLAAEQMALLPGQEPLAAQLASFGTTTPYRLRAEVEEIALPFLGTDPLPIVTLSIGGREHPFVLDTGSSQLVIDSGLMREMALPNFGTREATFASGQRARIAHTVVQEVALGEAILQDVPAEVMDVRRAAPQISGFIGTNFLQRFHVLCDWEGQVLRLRPQRQPRFSVWEGMISAPFYYLDSHLLLASGQLNQHETMVYLASGMAGGAFAVPASTVVQARLEQEAETMEGVGAGGTLQLTVALADQICVGAWCREDMQGFSGFFPSELEWRYGFRVGALLSQEFIRHRRWGIDFERCLFYFD